MYHTITREDGTIEVHEREVIVHGDKMVPATYGKMYEISPDKIKACLVAYRDLISHATWLPDDLDISDEGTKEERLKRCFSNIKKIEIRSIAQAMLNRLSRRERYEFGDLLEDKSVQITK